MSNYKLKGSGLLFQVLLSVCMLGWGAASYANTVGNKTVSKVHVHSSNGIYFETAEPPVNPYNCSQSGIYRVAPNTKYEQTLFSMLLAARASHQKITFHISSVCTDNFITVDWINTHD